MPQDVRLHLGAVQSNRSELETYHRSGKIHDHRQQGFDVQDKAARERHCRVLVDNCFAANESKGNDSMALSPEFAVGKRSDSVGTDQQRERHGRLRLVGPPPASE